MQLRQVLIGLLLLGGIVLFHVSATQLMRNFVLTTDAPFFFTTFSTVFLLFCFPGYAFVVVCSNVIQSRPLTFGLSHSLSLFGPGTQVCSCKPLVRRVLPLCIIYIVTNYLYALALRTLTNTEVSATMAMESMLVYLLSFALLGQRDVGLAVNIQHIISSLFAVAGIVCISMSNIQTLPCTTGRPNNTGLILPAGMRNESLDNCENWTFSTQRVIAFIPACFSAFGAGLYKVTFKKLIGSPSAGQVSLFLTLLGAMSAFLCFPIAVYLITANIETVPSTWDGWLFVLLSSLFGLCFNWLVNYGVSVTFPLFIAVGYTLHVPANAIVDRIVRQDTFEALKISGVVVSFVAMIVISIPLATKRENRNLEIKIEDNGNYQSGATIEYKKETPPESNLTDSLINK